MREPDKVHENLLRRRAKRQGLELVKSRRRDPLALDYGTYWLVDAKSGRSVAGGERGLTMAAVEERLSRGRP